MREESAVAQGKSLEDIDSLKDVEMKSSDKSLNSVELEEPIVVMYFGAGRGPLIRKAL